MLGIFKVNIALQSSAASKVHVVRDEMLRLLRRVMSFFVQPGEIRAVEDVLEVDYTDPGKQVFDEELFIGDSALALICHQSDNEGKEPEMSSAYDHMRAFHSAFVVKLIKAFPFNSKALQLLSFLDPEKVLSILLRNVQEPCDKFAVTCDNDAVVMEFREFLSDPAAVAKRYMLWARAVCMQCTLVWVRTNIDTVYCITRNFQCNLNLGKQAQKTFRCYLILGAREVVRSTLISFCTMLRTNKSILRILGVTIN